MISHRNVISNVLQLKFLEKPVRDKRSIQTEVCLGLLPLSHIYGLVVIAQASTYKGDEAIILPKFELQSYLKSIETYKIKTLFLVSESMTWKCLLTQIGPSDYYSDGQKSSGML